MTSIYMKSIFKIKQKQTGGESDIRRVPTPDLMTPGGIMARGVFKNFSPNLETGF